jgi:folylpolyglutamate synthase/dihydropteroate synthase
MQSLLDNGVNIFGLELLFKSLRPGVALDFEVEWRRQLFQVAIKSPPVLADVAHEHDSAGAAAEAMPTDEQAAARAITARWQVTRAAAAVRILDDALAAWRGARDTMTAEALRSLAGKLRAMAHDADNMAEAIALAAEHADGEVSQ